MLSLGRQLVNLLPVAQRGNAFTNSVVDRPGVVGCEFESHVHQKNPFIRKAIFLMSKILKILLDPQQMEPRVGDTLTRISGPFQGGNWCARYMVAPTIDWYRRLPSSSSKCLSGWLSERSGSSVRAVVQSFICLLYTSPSPRD